MGASAGDQRSRCAELPDPEYSLPARRRLPGGVAIILSLRGGDWRLAGSAGTAVCGRHERGRVIGYVFPQGVISSGAVLQAKRRISRRERQSLPREIPPRLNCAGFGRKPSARGLGRAPLPRLSQSLSISPGVKVALPPFGITIP